MKSAPPLRSQRSSKKLRKPSASQLLVAISLLSSSSPCFSSLYSNMILLLPLQVTSYQKGTGLDISFHVQGNNLEGLICRSLMQHIAPRDIVAAYCRPALAVQIFLRVSVVVAVSHLHMSEMRAEELLQNLSQVFCEYFSYCLLYFS